MVHNYINLVYSCGAVKGNYWTGDTHTESIRRICHPRCLFSSFRFSGSCRSPDDSRKRPISILKTVPLDIRTQDGRELAF
jgi:hypothetical protein